MLINKQLAALANVCSKYEGGKFGLVCCVHLRLQPDGIVRAEGTDGRRLLIVQHCNEDDQGGVPVGMSLFVPADSWKQVFKLGEKAHHSIRLEVEELENELEPTEGVVGRIGPKVTRTMIFSDVDGTQMVRVPMVEGRYPDVNGVLPSGPPRARFLIDPLLLAEMLRAVSAFGTDDSRSVEVMIYGPDKPVAVRASYDNGLVVDGMIVPLVERGKETKPVRHAPPEAEVEEPPVEEESYEPNDEPRASEIKESEPESETQPAPESMPEPEPEPETECVPEPVMVDAKPVEEAKVEPKPKKPRKPRAKKAKEATAESK